MKFHENSSSGSRIVRCRQAAMTKLIVAFRTFEKEPENYFNLEATTLLGYDTVTLATGFQTPANKVVVSSQGRN